jgi:hypothetical protein
MLLDLVMYLVVQLLKWRSKRPLFCLREFGRFLWITSCWQTQRKLIGLKSAREARKDRFPVRAAVGSTKVRIGHHAGRAAFRPFFLPTRTLYFDLWLIYHQLGLF